jgi:hypothetical protein
MIDGRVVVPFCLPLVFGTEIMLEMAVGRPNCRSMATFAVADAYQTTAGWHN